MAFDWFRFFYFATTVVVVIVATGWNSSRGCRLETRRFAFLVFPAAMAFGEQTREHQQGHAPHNRSSNDGVDIVGYSLFGGYRAGRLLGGTAVATVVVTVNTNGRWQSNIVEPYIPEHAFDIVPSFIMTATRLESRQ